MLNALSEIAQIRAIVEQSKLIPAKEVFLRRKAVVKMAHSSTSIEGNMLAEYQVEKLAQGIKIQANEKEVKEVENYLAALHHIDELSTSKESFYIQDILDIHAKVMKDITVKEKAGAWRKGPVYIVNVTPVGEEKLVYTPPDSKEIPYLILDLIDWVNTQRDIHPIIRAGLFHYQFETIHPFPDGNGRTGRLMTLLHLYQSDWDFKKALVLENFYNLDRKKYFQSLQTGHTYKSRDGANLTPWLEYFIGGFFDEAKRLKDTIVNLTVIGQDAPQKNILTNDELRIVDFVLTMGKITSADAVDILQVPKRTAQAKLKRLEDIKVLEKRSAGPATYYVIPNIM